MCVFCVACYSVYSHNIVRRPWCVIYRLSISNINILIYIYLYIYFQTKCEKYWPDLGSSLRLGALVITSKKETKYAAFITRELQLEITGKKVLILYLIKNINK